MNLTDFTPPTSYLIIEIMRRFFNVAVLNTLGKSKCFINFPTGLEADLVVGNKYIESPGVIYVSLKIINSRKAIYRIKRLYLIIKSKGGLPILFFAVILLRNALI